MTTALARPSGRKPTPKSRIMQARASGNVARRANLPEYLEMAEVEALLHLAPHANARLLFLVQWRAGLRVSEALALEAADLVLEGDDPTLRVREGKGGRARVVPIHPELAAAFRNFLAFGNVPRGPFFHTSRSTAWRWLKNARSSSVDCSRQGD